MMSDNPTTPRNRGFPALELAIVLVVLGIVASVVVPRMSRGAPAANPADARDAVLVGRLKLLRTAVAAYTRDHGGHPPDPDRIVSQLTAYTDWAGRTNRARTGQHVLGPYLREIPQLPVGDNKGKSTIGLVTDPHTGWTYDPITANVRPNTRPDERDRAGRPYAGY
jgi:type II secretory pathway pseudopilin PulG